MNPSEEKTELRTVDDFIAFFSAIPEDRWCTGDYTDSQGRCCAGGHLGERLDGIYNPNNRRLAMLFCEHLEVDSVCEINDGEIPRFQQPTPRARILAALNAIKANQEKK